jgi:hypothetical protein
MSSARLRTEPSLSLAADPFGADDLDEALVADYAAAAARRLLQLDAALAAARVDAAAIAELVRVLRSLSDGASQHGFHAVGKRAEALEELLLSADGGPESMPFEQLAELRADMSQVFAEAQHQAEVFMGQAPHALEHYAGGDPAKHRQPRLVIAVLEGRPTLWGAVAATAVARAGTHLLTTGGRLAQTYRESGGDGLVIRLHREGRVADGWSDLQLEGGPSRAALLAGSCDGAVIATPDDQSLGDGRTLLAAGKPVVQLVPPGPKLRADPSWTGRLILETDAERAVVELLVELSRER